MNNVKCSGCKKIVASPFRSSLMGLLLTIITLGYDTITTESKRGCIAMNVTKVTTRPSILIARTIIMIRPMPGKCLRRIIDK